MSKSKNQTIDKNQLIKIPIFSELTDDELLQVLRLGSKIKFRKKGIIFSEGEEYRGFYVVIKGSVKISKLSSSGKEYILHIIKPNQTFADVPLFEGGNIQLTPLHSKTANYFSYQNKVFSIYLKIILLSV